MSLAALAALATGGCRTTTVTPLDGGSDEASAATASGSRAGGEGGTVGDGGPTAAMATTATVGNGTAGAADGGPPLHLAYVTTQDARAAATAAVTAAYASAVTPDCDAILRALDINLGIAGIHADATTKAAFVAFGRCARDAHEWRLLREIGFSLTDFDPSLHDNGFPAEANAGYAHFAAADTDFKDLLRKWPRDGHVYLEAARNACRMENWNECLKRVDQTLGFQRTKSADDEVTLDARVLRAIALLHTNKQDDAGREVDAVAKASTKPKYVAFKQRFDESRTTHLWIDTDVDDDVYPALLPMYGTAVLGPFATMRLWNLSGHALDVKVSVTVNDVTEPASQVVHFTAQKATVKLNPVRLATLGTPGSAGHASSGAGTVSIKITDKTGYSPILERSIPASIHAADELPTILASGPKSEPETTWRDIRELEAIRIHPDDPAVTAWIAAAKTRAPNAGWAVRDGASIVHALWDELAARKMAFGRDASRDSDRGAAINVSPPAAVLGALSGTELEGVVLFASALEAIGLPVVLVNTPGHQLVGWLGNSDHSDHQVPSPVGSAVFLDPAAMGALPFDAAILRADTDVVEATDRGAFIEQRGDGLSPLAPAQERLRRADRNGSSGISGSDAADDTGESVDRVGPERASVVDGGGAVVVARGEGVEPRRGMLAAEHAAEIEQRQVRGPGGDGERDVVGKLGDVAVDRLVAEGPGADHAERHRPARAQRPRGGSREARHERARVGPVKEPA